MGKIFWDHSITYIETQKVKKRKLKGRDTR